VNHPNRTVHWRQRTRARTFLKKDSVISPDLQPSQPRHTLIQIDVTLTLRRRLVWLLVGIALGSLRLPDGLLTKAGIILRALLPG